MTFEYGIQDGEYNYYSLQLNSNLFSCTPPGGNATTAGPGRGCWEQFVFDNLPLGDNSVVFIEYGLIGYHSEYSDCPSGFSQSGNDCYMQSSANSVPNETPTTQLGSLSLSGQANFESSGDDQTALCNGGSCYSLSASDSVLGLYNDNWDASQFGIYGDYNGHTAGFNTATTFTVDNQEEQGSGSIITPTCGSYGFTGESNNLTLSGSCNVSGYYEIMSFPESG
jgi:hypothetical protein